MFIPCVAVLSGAKRSSVFLRTPCNQFTFRSRTDSVRSKSPLTASPASPGPLSNSLHGSFHGSLGSDGMSCSSARSSSASPDSARYSSSQVTIFIAIFQESKNLQLQKFEIKNSKCVVFRNSTISRITIKICSV